MALLTIRHDVYFHDDTATNNLLSLILNKLDNMALTLADFQTEFDKINIATNGIAAKITALEETIKGMGLNDADEATLLSQLSGVASQLEAIAAPTV